MIYFLLCTTFLLNASIDMGNIGRYEVQIRLSSNETLEAYIVVSTYDELKSNFVSDENFKEYLFNLGGYEHRDSLIFFENFYYVNYPEYEGRFEKLVAVLEEDWNVIPKTDIRNVKFISFQKLDFINLLTQLNREEIEIFQNEPESIKSLSIDSSQEGYSDMWMLSFNPEIKTRELDEVAEKIRSDYKNQSVKDDDMRNSWIYDGVLNNWQERLKKSRVYLIEVANP